MVQRFNDAREYIRILQRRQQTLMDVMTAIVALQKPYFLSGGDDSLLRPMGLKDVAAQTGLDVSVISRATRNKYAQLPWDTVPLRFFFSEAFAQQGATAEVSGRGVEQAIRRIVDAEDKRHPLSDENICRLLAADGFTVSRRTVSKYRDRLQIPVARLRR
ncbi:rNA polymerase sigma-54 factor [Prevotella sp. CAG:485]|nr:rNA polymerase sigma-54 factor [Prevotella sp. CAG:485]